MSWKEEDVKAIAKVRGQIAVPCLIAARTGSRQCWLTVDKTDLSDGRSRSTVRMLANSLSTEDWELYTAGKFVVRDKDGNDLVDDSETVYQWSKLQPIWFVRKPRKRATALPSFILRLPPLTTRKVWIGCYTMMCGTVIMLFKAKPTRDKLFHAYDVDDKHYIASIRLDEWLNWFGTVEPLVKAGLLKGNAKIDYITTGANLDCHKVIPIELTACWDNSGEYPTLCGLNVCADN